MIRATRCILAKTINSVVRPLRSEVSGLLWVPSGSSRPSQTTAAPDALGAVRLQGERLKYCRSADFETPPPLEQYPMLRQPRQH